MKQLVDAVAAHARRYHLVLDQSWKEIDWSRAQAEVTLRRIKSVLEKLPAAKKQAHERIMANARS